MAISYRNLVTSHGDMALKMLAKQLQRVYDDLPDSPGFSAGPLEDDLLHWEASIVGPENSPYEGGQFYIRIDFTADYPFKPPKVWFLTKVYHPNVQPDGKICADFLTDWKPTFSVSYILLALCTLLMHPDVENPAVAEIAELYKKDIDKFNTTAKEYTVEHAKPDF